MSAPAEAPMPEPEPPWWSTLEPETVTFVFNIDIDVVPPPEPEPNDDPEAPPPEPVEPPTLEGTFFQWTVPGEPSAEEGAAPPENSVFELEHPKSSEGAPESASAAVVVSGAFIKWLVVERQGKLTLSFRKREGSESEELCALPLDVCSLLFGKRATRTEYVAPAEGTASALPQTGGSTDRSPDALQAQLPDAVAGLVARLAIELATEAPLLSDEMRAAYNPMSLTLVRADGMPPSYSGTPFKAPFIELAQRCKPVFVKVDVVGSTHTTAGLSHGPSLVWKERRLHLVGPALIEPEQLTTLLRDQGLRLELHDRDPKLPLAAETSPAVQADEAAAPGTEPEEAAAADADAPFPPHGVGQVSLAQLLPRRSTEGAYYAPTGIPTSASRHASLCVTMVPCERPKKKPEPEEDLTEYFAGGYIESGTCLSLKLELATPAATRGGRVF